MKRIAIKKISAKQRAKNARELPIRKALCERCGGTWIPAEIGDGGVCAGGNCEVCGSPPLPPEYLLRPHEKEFRSKGGKLTLKNSVMACIVCQNKPHRIEVKLSEPQFGRRE